MIAPTETETCSTRICSRCWQQLPIKAFARRRKGTERRHSQCQACQNAAAVQRRKRRRTSLLRDALRECRRPRNSVDRNIALIGSVVDQLGGPEAFATRAAETMRTERSPANRLRIHATFVLLLSQFETHQELLDRDAQEREQKQPRNNQRPPRPVTDLTDGELLTMASLPIQELAKRGLLRNALSSMVDRGEILPDDLGQREPTSAANHRSAD